MTAPKRSPAPDTSEFIKRVMIVLALATFVFLLWQLRTVVVMLFGAVVIATVFRTLADPLINTCRIPERVAIGVAILIVAAVLIAIGWLFGSQIGGQFRSLADALPKAWSAAEDQLRNLGVSEQFIEHARSPSPSGGGFLSSAGNVIMSVSSGMADTLVVLFGGIFLAIQPRVYRTGAIKLIPQRRRDLVGEAMDESESALQLWLKAQLISMTVIGLLTWAGLWFLGVPSALALALIAFALEFIPFAGPIIASIPAILIAMTISPEIALWTAGLYLLVQQAEGNLVYPLVQQWAVHIPAAVLIFSLIAFGILFGTLGVIFAAPLTVVTYVMVKRLYVREALHTATPIPGEDDA